MHCHACQTFSGWISRLLLCESTAGVSLPDSRACRLFAQQSRARLTDGVTSRLQACTVLRQATAPSQMMIWRDRAEGKDPGHHVAQGAAPAVPAPTPARQQPCQGNPYAPHGDARCQKACRSGVWILSTYPHMPQQLTLLRIPMACCVHAALAPHLQASVLESACGRWVHACKGMLVTQGCHTTSRRQGSNSTAFLRAVGGVCQGRPAVCRAFIHVKEEIARQGRLESCHIMSAATHLVCGSEGV